ncbi:helix-turn-helix transcriptional regulator [Aliiglaciecola sp. CAU 1673]|uniref:helix-turn-helix domain-containing protein n=1 Tax=Aliiglaciecola sp. CAU 1673 TaxID=3032595 RepID=UPI0023DB65B6|nr:helix-turn-helix transcriptional regulator [Aliiglaciecola sp. CAU 1673]MDF2179696.1 helix-turn-helix transcriptional regulator [Aliiglaciecola sp. CAU 1673]
MENEKIIAQEEYELVIELLQAYYQELLSMGQMIKIMRKDILELNQTQFAELTGISRRTLSDLEQDKGSPTLSVLDAVFAPLGVKTSLLPNNDKVLKQVAASLGS